MAFDREHTLTRFESLLEAAERIHHDDLASESRLMTLKWYDYRFMSPMEATMLFGKLYQAQFRDSLARHVDRHLAHISKGINLATIMSNPRELTGLWRARQHADELGIGYPEYLRFCFDFATNRKRKALPRPNQLYFNEKTEAAWLDMLTSYWLERVLEGVAKVNDLPQYRFENYRRLPAQDEYRQFILDRAKEGTKRWRSVMRVHAVEKRQLPIRDFVPTVGRELFLRELRSLKDDGRASPFQIDPHVVVSDDRLWQSCFGVPYARRPDQNPCSVCPQSAGCQKVADHVLQKIKERHGTCDPVRQKQRERGRDRVRRHRAKKKTTSAAASPASPGEN